MIRTSVECFEANTSYAMSCSVLCGCEYEERPEMLCEVLNSRDGVERNVLD